MTCELCGLPVQPVTDEDALRRAREAYGPGVVLWQHDPEIQPEMPDHLPVVSQQ